MAAFAASRSVARLGLRACGGALASAPGRAPAACGAPSPARFAPSTGAAAAAAVARGLAGSGAAWRASGAVARRVGAPPSPLRGLSTGAGPTPLQRARQALEKAAAEAEKSPLGRARSAVLGALNAPAKLREAVVGSTDVKQFARATAADTRKAFALRVEAFWQRNSAYLIGAAGVGVVVVIWRTMFGIASTFINLSETFAESGFLALACACGAFGYLYVKRLYTVNPDTLYGIVMRRLNEDPAVLQVLGAPLVGTEVRAYVMTGGGLRMKGFRPTWRSRRCHLIFPLKGAERKAIVSCEVKKRNGNYKFKLLAVDVPTASGDETRIFLAGDSRAYMEGSVISELRDPLVQSISVDESGAHEQEDDLDEELEAAEARREAYHAKPKPLDQGGGMYFYERVVDTLGRAWHDAKSLVRKLQPQ